MTTSFLILKMENSPKMLLCWCQWFDHLLEEADYTVHTFSRNSTEIQSQEFREWRIVAGEVQLQGSPSFCNESSPSNRLQTFPSRSFLKGFVNVWLSTWEHLWASLCFLILSPKTQTPLFFFCLSFGQLWKGLIAPTESHKSAGWIGKDSGRLALSDAL